MNRYGVAGPLTFRHWEGEDTALARLPAAGTTHLIETAALAVVQAAATGPQGLSLREIAHTLGLDDGPDQEAVASLQRIIDGLIQSGLLCRVDDDDPDPGAEPSR